jgi:hypothetical protein
MYLALNPLSKNVEKKITGQGNSREGLRYVCRIIAK